MTRYGKRPGTSRPEAGEIGPVGLKGALMERDPPMNFIQRLFTRFVSPTRAAAMEAESRTWMVRCPRCGYERSVWEMGGVRYKAAGTSWQLHRCPHCGKLAWHKIYQKRS